MANLLTPFSPPKGSQRFVLLGAGASVDAKIPHAFAMTNEFLQLFSQDFELRRESHALRYVVGGLMMQKGAKGDDPLSGVNIEDVFNAMQTLASRQLFEAAPFVAGWHPMVEELDTVSLRSNLKHSVPETRQTVNASIARDIDSAISDLVQQRHSSRQVGKKVQRMVEDSLRNLRSEVSGGGDRSGDGRVFRATCDAMVKKLISLVWLKSEDRDRVEYLRPLVRYAFENSVFIATLNYDTTIEVATQAEGLFVHSFMGEVAHSEEEAENCINLLKPHGSIDWCSNKSFFPDDVLPQARVLRADPAEMGKRDYTPAVIFGQRNKLTAEGPFLSFFSLFQAQLMRAKELVIIGYSFRDDHVNESIAAWFNLDSTRTIILVTPDSLWAKQSEFADRLGRLTTAGGRVRVVPKTAKEAIPTLFSVADAK